MGLAFPDTPHYYTWAELRILATALGYPRNTLVNGLHSVGDPTALGLSSKELLQHLELGHLFDTLHFTYNLKTGYHNATVIRKCVELLDAKLLSFPEIRSVALAFSAYDHLDQRGIEVEERTLTRAFKMCGRITAPRRLTQFIRGKQSVFVEPGRIQMYEFMELLPLCVDLDSIHLHETTVGATEKSYRGIYEMDDMKALLQTVDAKRLEHMNALYEQEQRALRHGGSGGATVAAGNGAAADPWRRQMEAEKLHHQMMKQQLQLSAIQLRSARTRDLLRARPTTAPSHPWGGRGVSRPASRASARGAAQSPVTASADPDAARRMTPATRKTHLKFVDAIEDQVTSADEPATSSTRSRPEEEERAVRRTPRDRSPGYRDRSAPRPLTAPAVSSRLRSISAGQRSTDAWRRLMSGTNRS